MPRVRNIIGELRRVSRSARAEADKQYAEHERRRKEEELNRKKYIINESKESYKKCLGAMRETTKGLSNNASVDLGTYGAEDGKAVAEKVKARLERDGRGKISVTFSQVERHEPASDGYAESYRTETTLHIEWDLRAK